MIDSDQTNSTTFNETVSNSTTANPLPETTATTTKAPLVQRWGSIAPPYDQGSFNRTEPFLEQTVGNLNYSVAPTLGQVDGNETLLAQVVGNTTPSAQAVGNETLAPSGQVRENCLPRTTQSYSRTECIPDQTPVNPKRKRRELATLQ